MNLLLIDDQLQVLQTLKEMLEPAGHVCWIETNPADALTLLQQEPFDVVVSDLRMPVMSGLEVLKQIQCCHPGLPVIIVTGYADTQSAVAALNHGAYAFMHKPLDLEDFFRIIERIEKDRRERKYELRLFEKLQRSNRNMAENLRLQMIDQVHFLEKALLTPLPEESAIRPESFRERLRARLNALEVLYTMADPQLNDRQSILPEYIRRMIRRLHRNLLNGTPNVTFRFHLDEVVLEFDHLQAWALIVHEIMHVVLDQAIGSGTRQMSLIEIDVRLVRQPSGEILFQMCHGSGSDLQPDEEPNPDQWRESLRFIDAAVRETLGGRMIIHKNHLSCIAVQTDSADRASLEDQAMQLSGKPHE